MTNKEYWHSVYRPKWGWGAMRGHILMIYGDVDRSGYSNAIITNTR